MKTITEKEFKTNIDLTLSQAIDYPIKIIDEKNEYYLSTINDINIIDNEWVNNFMAIPEEFRINPFQFCDTGDLYWADKRNSDKVKNSLSSLKSTSKNLANSKDFEKEYKKLLKLMWVILSVLFLLILGLYFVK